MSTGIVLLIATIVFVLATKIVVHDKIYIRKKVKHAPETKDEKPKWKYKYLGKTFFNLCEIDNNKFLNKFIDLYGDGTYEVFVQPEGKIVNRFYIGSRNFRATCNKHGEPIKPSRLRNGHRKPECSDCYNQGYLRGVEKGRQIGKKEGYLLGLKKGKKIRTEEIVNNFENGQYDHEPLYRVPQVSDVPPINKKIPPGKPPNYKSKKSPATLNKNRRE